MRKWKITGSEVCNWETRKRLDSSHCSLSISEVEMDVTVSAGPVRKGNRSCFFPNFPLLMVWKASLAEARRKWWDGPGDLFGLWEEKDKSFGKLLEAGSWAWECLRLIQYSYFKSLHLQWHCSSCDAFDMVMRYLQESRKAGMKVCQKRQRIKII